MSKCTLHLIVVDYNYCVLYLQFTVHSIYKLLCTLFILCPVNFTQNFTQYSYLQWRAIMSKSTVHLIIINKLLCTLFRKWKVYKGKNKTKRNSER